MSRFHFNVDQVIDDVGIEFVDQSAMETEAMRAAGTMISEITSFPQRPWTMVVKDADQRTIATLTFAAT